MRVCAFLSTYEEEVECFEDCPLYNYKDNGYECPFKNLEEVNDGRVYTINYEQENGYVSMDLNFMMDIYVKGQEKYL